MITTVLFDLDGLLADTERLHRQAYQEVLAAYGIELSDTDYEEHWIRLGRGIVDFLQRRGGTLDVRRQSQDGTRGPARRGRSTVELAGGGPASPRAYHQPLTPCALDAAELRRQKAARYQELVATEAKPMPGVPAVLERLCGRKKLALASSAYRDAVEAVVRALGIGRYFSLIVAGSDVARSKPFPDIFLFAAQRLEAPASECVVVEDAEKGVVAARAAGMACIAVPNHHTRSNDFSRATLVLPSLDAITLELLESAREWGGYSG